MDFKKTLNLFQTKLFLLKFQNYYSEMEQSIHNNSKSYKIYKLC